MTHSYIKRFLQEMWACKHEDCVKFACSLDDGWATSKKGALLQCAAVYCSALQCVAVSCSVLQCVPVFCNVLQCVATCCTCSLDGGWATSKKNTKKGALLQ